MVCWAGLQKSLRISFSQVHVHFARIVDSAAADERCEQRLQAARHNLALEVGQQGAAELLHILGTGCGKLVGRACRHDLNEHIVAAITVKK